MTVFVNHPPSVTHHDIVAACARLRRAGFVPGAACRGAAAGELHPGERFPAARGGRGGCRAHPDHRWRRQSGGSVPRQPRPPGDRRGRSGTASREVAFAGYPEGHPGIDSRTLDEALRAKVALARQRGLEVSLVTQFGFEAAPILRWIAALRAQGIDCPVQVGVAGPATCRDVGQVRGPLRHRRVVARAGPRPHRLRADPGGSRPRRADRRAGGGRGRPDAPIDGLHVFTFGGVRRAAELIRHSTEL